MALDPVVKVEITAHNSIMDTLIEDIQRHSILQIDPHSVEEWESEKFHVTAVSQNLLELKKESTEVERAIEFLKGFEKPIPLLKKLGASPQEISKEGLKKIVEENNATGIKDKALELEGEISNIHTSLKDIFQKCEALLPFQNYRAPLSDLTKEGKVEAIVSKLERETFEPLLEEGNQDLIYIEKISGDETIFFSIIYHETALERVLDLEKEYHFEPLALPEIAKTPKEIINEYNKKSDHLKKEIDQYEDKATQIALKASILRYYYDYLQSEIAKESAKEKFFYTEKVFVLDGWLRERDYPLLQNTIDKYKEASVHLIEKEEEEIPPVVYKNNNLVSPFELIVNLYSPPNPKEIDPTPILMPFYALFFGICLTDAGYGLIVTLICALGLLLIKPRNGMKKFLNLFLILGISTFVVGALIGTVFGIDFDILPENLAWLREARYKIMIFDSSKDVLTFFGLSLALGVLHLIAGYSIKIYMLIKSGDWVEAVCDHLPWIFLLLAPVPKVLIKILPQYEEVLNAIFYVLLALWVGIIVLFSERNSLNPIKRLGKGLFTLYGVSGVLGDVLSYSRLLALGLATGVIAGVMNTLAGMVKQLPIVGIIGFFLVLLIGHLFNLFISGLSAFVHSIRLQFMEFFTKFYTGEGELLAVFSEKRKYTYVPQEKVGAIIDKSK